MQIVDVTGSNSFIESDVNSPFCPIPDVTFFGEIIPSRLEALHRRYIRFDASQIGSTRHEELIPIMGFNLDTERFFNQDDKQFRYCELPAEMGEAYFQGDPNLVGRFTENQDVARDTISNLPLKLSGPSADDISTPETSYRYFYYFPQGGQEVGVLKVPDRLTLEQNILSREDRHLEVIHGLKDHSLFDTLKENVWSAQVTLGGTGTVGRVVAEYLARYGVGNIRVFERDTNDTHQMKSGRVTLILRGKPKGPSLQETVFQINPYTIVDHIDSYLTAANLELAITPDTKFYICAHDDLAMKIAAWKRCRELRVPYILATDVGSQAVFEMQVFTGGEEDNYYLGSGEPLADRILASDLEQAIQDFVRQRDDALARRASLPKTQPIDPNELALYEAEKDSISKDLKTARGTRILLIAQIVGLKNVTYEMATILAEQADSKVPVPLTQPALAASILSALAGYNLEKILLTGQAKSSVFAKLNVADVTRTLEEIAKREEMRDAALGELFAKSQN